MDELKPCPFCGNVEPLVVVDDETEELFGVCCFKCESAIKAVFEERAEAVEAWNRRADPESAYLKASSIRPEALPHEQKLRRNSRPKMLCLPDRIINNLGQHGYRLQCLRIRRQTDL